MSPVMSDEERPDAWLQPSATGRRAITQVYEHLAATRARAASVSQASRTKDSLVHAGHNIPLPAGGSAPSNGFGDGLKSMAVVSGRSSRVT